jgi:hypothetical protein
MDVSLSTIWLDMFLKKGGLELNPSQAPCINMKPSHLLPWLAARPGVAS